MTPKWIQKSDRVFGEMLLGAPLVVQTVFGIKKWAPSAAKVLPRLENEPKITQKRSASAKMSCKSRPFSEPNENALQKRTLFGSRPGGLREALTIMLLTTPPQ